MSKVKKGKEGLKTKELLDKIKQELNNIQKEGKERIIFIAERLEQELINQGYEMKDCSLIMLWKHPGYKIEIEIDGKSIGGGKIGN